jgi:hypothetical protein
MADPQLSPLSYVAATVLGNDLVFILSQVDELNERSIDHTKVLRWKNGQWGHYMIDWPTTHIVQDHRHGGIALLSLGVNGTVHVAQGKDRIGEPVDASNEGPPFRGVLRDLRIIDGVPYVAGMKRQVYRRNAPGQWQRVDAGVVLPVTSQEMKGFNSIDGFSPQDLYAVGLEGEIWSYDGKAWTQLDSPTSVALQRVLCAPDGNVYAAGQSGTLLKGRGSAWQVIDLGDFRETIWDICWFKDHLYIGSSRDLRVLDAGGARQVNMPLQAPRTFGRFATNGEVLWTIGQKTLTYTHDGNTWTEVMCMDGSY